MNKTKIYYQIVLIFQNISQNDRGIAVFFWKQGTVAHFPSQNVEFFRSIQSLMKNSWSQNDFKEHDNTLTEINWSDWILHSEIKSEEMDFESPDGFLNQGSKLVWMMRLNSLLVDSNLFNWSNNSSSFGSSWEKNTITTW